MHVSTLGFLEGRKRKKNHFKENAQLKRTIAQMQQMRDDEIKWNEEEVRVKEAEKKLIDSMTGILNIEMDWMDRKKEAVGLPSLFLFSQPNKI